MATFMFNDGSGPRLVKLPNWAIGLIVAGVALVGVVFLVLAAGVALIAIPVLLVGGGIAGWVARKRGRAMMREEWPTDEGGRTHGSVIIEGDYKVIDKTTRE